MRWLGCRVVGLFVFFGEGGWREEVREGEGRGGEGKERGRGDRANCKGGVVHALASLLYRI